MQRQFKMVAWLKFKTLTLSNMASRNIYDLSAAARVLYVKFDAAMRAAGIDYIVTCTYRSNDDQTALYAQGRTKPGAIVTNAKAGQSKHNAVDADGKPASQAFDIVIMKNGKPDWDVKDPDWMRAGAIGESVGLEWAGRWISFKEFPHFQIKG